eukprot:CAMPEP_0194444506 /NCGR_PEP_ID=MMETSP0176-20130528/127307_1 /TAXON_ID=216777 /ORGANISM="Proboscia alata, Strain PI-D3" /LENGTH=378 /DNA_ID=CAMNT_0039270887 /DNA_START=309 /DNA_END=1445 /DNA_ORIENTATION=-
MQKKKYSQNVSNSGNVGAGNGNQNSSVSSSMGNNSVSSSRSGNSHSHHSNHHSVSSSHHYRSAHGGSSHGSAHDASSSAADMALMELDALVATSSNLSSKPESNRESNINRDPHPQVGRNSNMSDTHSRASRKGVSIASGAIPERGGVGVHHSGNSVYSTAATAGYDEEESANSNQHHSHLHRYPPYPSGLRSSSGNHGGGRAPANGDEEVERIISAVSTKLSLQSASASAQIQHSQSQYNIQSKSLHVNTPLRRYLSSNIASSAAAKNNYVQKILSQMEAKSENNTVVALNAQYAATNTQKGASLPKSRNTSASTGSQIKLSNRSYYTAEDEDEESSNESATSTSEDDSILGLKKDAVLKKASSAAQEKKSKLASDG